MTLGTTILLSRSRLQLLINGLHSSLFSCHITICAPTCGSTGLTRLMCIGIGASSTALQSIPMHSMHPHPWQDLLLPHCATFVSNSTPSSFQGMWTLLPPEPQRQELWHCVSTYSFAWWMKLPQNRRYEEGTSSTFLWSPWPMIRSSLAIFRCDLRTLIWLSVGAVRGKLQGQGPCIRVSTVITTSVSAIGGPTACITGEEAVRAPTGNVFII